MNARRAVPLWFLLPNLLGFLTFTAGPIVFSALSSFTNWNIQRPGQTSFIGLGNYAELLGDPKFWLSFINTLYFMLGIPVSIGISLWIAILLNRKMRGNGAIKALLFLPSVTSGVAIMILWKQLYNPDFGPVNQVIEQVGGWLGLHLHGPQWLQSTGNLASLDIEKVGVDGKQFGLGARDALNFMGLWGAIGGSNMLLYLAGLTNVPEELLEAAQVDGASKWDCFRKITWPQLAPTTFFISVMSINGGLQGGFETARVMTNGGPSGTTTTAAYYIYNQAFSEFRLGYASSVSWILFGIIFLITLLNWKFGNKEDSLV